MIKLRKGTSAVQTVAMLSLLLAPMGPKAQNAEKTITLLERACIYVFKGCYVGR